MTEFDKINKFFKPIAGVGSNDLCDDVAVMKPYVVSRLLKEHFNIKISESAVRHHFQNLVADG